MRDVVFYPYIREDIVLHLRAGPDKLLVGILSNLLHDCPVHLGRPADTHLAIHVIEPCPSVPCVPLVSQRLGLSDGFGSLACVRAITLDFDD